MRLIVQYYDTVIWHQHHIESFNLALMLLLLLLIDKVRTAGPAV